MAPKPFRISQKRKLATLERVAAVIGGFIGLSIALLIVVIAIVVPFILVGMGFAIGYRWAS